MKRYVIDLDMSKCVSCGACVIACMDQNDWDAAAGDAPFRRVFNTSNQREGGTEFVHFSLGCMHCEDAPCIAACRRACISKDPETNFTVYDTAGCVGCHSCVRACPYGIPGFGGDGKMKKCDGCFVRVRRGLLPACVKTCPVKALRLVERDGESPIAPQNSLRLSGLDVLFPRK